MARRAGPLDRLETLIRSGGLRRSAWELLRLQLYPSVESNAAKRRLIAWAKKKGIGVTFELQTVYAGATRLDVTYVSFSPGEVKPSS